MNNISFPNINTEKNGIPKEKENPKKLDYKKEIRDIEKILNALIKKYEISPNVWISNSIMDIRSSLEKIKRFEENV